MLIVCIKILAMLKCQLFDKSNSKKKWVRIYKCPWIDKNNNKEENLNKYEDGINGYVFFSPTLALLLP